MSTSVIVDVDTLSNEADALTLWAAVEGMLLCGLHDHWSVCRGPGDEALAHSPLHTLSMVADALDRLTVTVAVRTDLTPTRVPVATRTLHSVAEPLFTRLSWRWPLRVPVGPVATAPWGQTTMADAA